MVDNLMPRDLVPEIHDALKLTTLKHNFEDFDPYQPHAPNTPSWRGVLQHHCDELFPAYPTDRDTFLLHLADGLAANFSRHPQNIQQDAAWTVHRLWNPQAEADDARLSKPRDIQAMLEFLGTDPSFEEFFARYERIYETRAEDAHPGMNITTLDTHVRLVGRFYRFLRQANTLQVEEQELREAAAGGVNSVNALRERKKQDWQIHLVRCRPRLLVNPFRARDLNVFDALDQFIGEAAKLFADHILFAGTEELLLYSDNLRVLDDLRRVAEPLGIALEVERTLAQLTAKNILGELIGERPRKKPVAERHYPALDRTVNPPLCEICQMRAATRVWPDDYVARFEGEPPAREQGKDQLCETCFSIRSRPSKLKKLAHWEEWGEGELIWARFGLDFSQLYKALGCLYLDYLRSLAPSTEESKAEVRFSLVAEFQRDYEKYLTELTHRLLSQFGHERAETILPDFFCIKAEAAKEVFSVLGCFLEAATVLFPALLPLPECPLRLSLALCDVKHPFFEVWRAWEEQRNEVEITAVGHGRLQLKVRDLAKFLELADFPFRKSALHNLAEISRISQQLAELRFRARGERGERKTFEHLSEFLPLGLTFDGILTLAKLVGA